MINPIEQLNDFEKAVGTRYSLTSAAQIAKRDNHLDTLKEIKDNIQHHSYLVALKRAYLMGYKEGRGEGNQRDGSVPITVPITWATHYGKKYKIHPDYIEAVRIECELVLKKESESTDKIKGKSD